MCVSQTACTKGSGDLLGFIRDPLLFQLSSTLRQEPPESSGLSTKSVALVSVRTNSFPVRRVVSPSQLEGGLGRIPVVLALGGHGKVVWRVEGTCSA